MSLAAAVTIRVGYRLGQGSTLDAQTAARTGLMVGVCMATLTAIFTVSLREQIALLYNDNPGGCNAGGAFDVAGGGISDF